MKIKNINLEKVSLKNKRLFCKEIVMSYLTEEEWKNAKSGFLPYLNKIKSEKLNILIKQKNVYGIFVCMNPNQNFDYQIQNQFMLSRFSCDGFEDADYLAQKYLTYEK